MSQGGARLYETVQEYAAAIGAHHRTGTAEDARTLTGSRIAWAPRRDDRAPAVVVRPLRLRVERHRRRRTSQRCRSSTKARVRSNRTTPLVAAVSAVRRAPSRMGDDRRGRAIAGAPVTVVATRSPSGGLVAPNRSPAQSGSGLPALLVAGALAERLRTASVRARVAARIVRGRTSNVIGRVGAGPDRDRILLTTPLSGWFRCGGERGTGIAVMLAVAERLAAEGVPILVNGNSGHELVDLGAHRFAETKPAARAVFHFGAGVAAGEYDGDDLRLTDRFKIRAWAPGAGAALAAVIRAPWQDTSSSSTTQSARARIMDRRSAGVVHARPAADLDGRRVSAVPHSGGRA